MLTFCVTSNVTVFICSQEEFLLYQSQKELLRSVVNHSVLAVVIASDLSLYFHGLMEALCTVLLVRK